MTQFVVFGIYCVGGLSLVTLTANLHLYRNGSWLKAKLELKTKTKIKYKSTKKK